MSLAQKLDSFVAAAFTGLWIRTNEPDEAEREILRHARTSKWKVALWDVANGLRMAGHNEAASPGGDPLAALRALPGLVEKDGTALLVVHNLHRFFNNPEVVQTAFNAIVAGKQSRTFLVVLSPVVQIPVELEKVFITLEHDLPDRAALEAIARELTSDSPDDLPKGDELDRVLDAAAGLTRYESEGAFALSLTTHNAIRPDVISGLKAEALKKSALLSLHRGNERFDSLGGLSSLKQFCQKALRSGNSIKARGVLLLGVAGSGKSAFCKALGNETGRPTLTLDLGSLMGSLVGSSEANVRRALQIADAMSPCVLFCDEVEKALAGVGSNGDSGVSTRMFGTLLTWLADHESDVFFACSANDISKLPPEFARAERFDAVFFLDLPTGKDKEAIWSMYRSAYAVPKSQAQPDDGAWTGAEIKSCCRLAALLGVSLQEAAHNVVPVAVTAAEQVERLRAWASGRCLSASYAGIYRRAGEESVKSSRRVYRGPSAN
ncbi:MAG: AAA family ATPase [Gemmataceae bacterium]